MVTNVKRVTLTVQGDFDLDDCTPNDPAKINWNENQKPTNYKCSCHQNQKPSWTTVPLASRVGLTNFIFLLVILD